MAAICSAPALLVSNQRQLPGPRTMLAHFFISLFSSANRNKRSHPNKPKFSSHTVSKFQDHTAPSVARCQSASRPGPAALARSTCAARSVDGSMACLRSSTAGPAGNHRRTHPLASKRPTKPHQRPRPAVAGVFAFPGTSLGRLTHFVCIASAAASAAIAVSAAAFSKRKEHLQPLFFRGTSTS